MVTLKTLFSENVQAFKIHISVLTHIYFFGARGSSVMQPERLGQMFKLLDCVITEVFYQPSFDRTRVATKLNR